MSVTVTFTHPIRLYDTYRDFTFKKRPTHKRRKRTIIITRPIDIQFYRFKRGLRLSLGDGLVAHDRIFGPKRKAPGRSSRNSPIIIRLIKLRGTCTEDKKCLRNSSRRKLKERNCCEAYRKVLQCMLPKNYTSAYYLVRV